MEDASPGVMCVYTTWWSWIKNIYGSTSSVQLGFDTAVHRDVNTI